MQKNIFTLLSITAAFFAQAQDVSTIRNTVEVYSNSTLAGSAKYNAMAGAMGALGADPSTLNVNPAGVGVAIASDLSGTLAIQSNKNSASFSGKATDYKINQTDLGQVGAIAAFNMSRNSRWQFVNLGINYSYQTIEDYTETPGNNAVALTDGNDELLFDGHAYNRYGSVSKMNIGLGGNYNNQFYVGVGLNFHNADVRQFDSSRFTFTGDNTTEVYDKQYTPFEEQSSGFSASVGAIAKVNNQFRLGAALETPTWWSIDRAFNEYGDADNTYAESRNLTTPMKATLSASYVANKNLALNVDYAIGLSKPKYKVEGPAETELNNFFDANYSNLSEVKVGAEYRVNQFRIRGGYAFANSPFKSVGITTFNNTGGVQEQNVTDMFASKRNTLGVGIGYDFRSFYIDAAYQNIKSSYNSPIAQGQYFSDNFSFVNDAAVISEVDNTKDNFYLTLGWRF